MSDTSVTRAAVFADALSERLAHDIKWGETCDHSPGRWLAVLTEELGEVATEMLESEDTDGLYRELIQLAATALAFAENILQGTNPNLHSISYQEES